MMIGRAMPLIALAAFGACGELLLNANTDGIDARAKSEIGRRFPELHPGSLKLKSMMWSRDFSEEEDRRKHPSLIVTYDVQGSIATNVVGDERLEKRCEVIVSMDENGNIPRGYIGVQTVTVTRSVSASATAAPPRGGLSLNFQNAPLFQITEFYSSLKGAPVAVDKSIRRNISCQSSSRLTEDEACRFIEAVLEEQGIRLERMKDGSYMATEAPVAP